MKVAHTGRRPTPKALDRHPFRGRLPVCTRRRLHMAKRPRPRDGFRRPQGRRGRRRVYKTDLRRVAAIAEISASITT